MNLKPWIILILFNLGCDDALVSHRSSKQVKSNWSNPEFKEDDLLREFTSDHGLSDEDSLVLVERTRFRSTKRDK